MFRTTEDARALVRAAQEIHAQRHGIQTFVPGTHLPFLEAAKRTGLRSDRQRYHDAIEDLEYEGGHRVGHERALRQGGQALPHHSARPGWCC